MKLKTAVMIITLVSIIFSCLFVTSVAPVAAATTLNVNLEGSNTAYKGQTYTLNINLPNVSSAAPKGLTAFEINVTFDSSKFEFVKATNKSGVTSGFFKSELVDTNVLKLNFVNSNNPLTKTAFCSIEFKCKSNASGNASFTGEVLASNTFDVDIINIPINIPVKITNKTVGIQTYQSSNANLKSLSTNLRSLTPQFNKNTTDYKVNIGNSYTSIEISAQVEDSNSNVTVSGGNNLKIGKINLVSGVYKCTVSNLEVGSNIITVLVTAQNGTTKKYTINVNRYPPESTQPSATPVQSSDSTPTPSIPTASPDKSPGPKTSNETATPTEPSTTPNDIDETPTLGTETPEETPAITSAPSDETSPGGQDNIIETFLNLDSSIVVGLSISMIIGLAIGFAFGYYVGRRKSFKSRF